MMVMSTAARPSILAACRPPKPAPTMTTCGRCCGIRSSSLAPVAIGPGGVWQWPRIPPMSRPLMPTHRLLLLAGDGIGPEVMAEVKRLLAFLEKRGIADFAIEEGLVGGACYDAHKLAITDETMAQAHAADAVIFGAVGGPKWDKGPFEGRPEAGR